MIDPQEARSLLDAFAARHDPGIAQLASMFLFMHDMSGAVPPFIQSVNMRVLAQCVHARIKEMGQDLDALERAIVDMQRVRTTMELLNSEPQVVSIQQAREGWAELLRKHRL
jgi:hypothetical protein